MTVEGEAEALVTSGLRKALEADNAPIRALRGVDLVVGSGEFVASMSTFDALFREGAAAVMNTEAKTAARTTGRSGRLTLGPPGLGRAHAVTIRACVSRQGPLLTGELTKEALTIEEVRLIAVATGNHRPAIPR
jgi:hypothetical protein